MSLRCLLLVVFLFSIFLFSDLSFAQQLSELPVNEDNSLRAYPAPDIEELQQAIWQVVGICIFAFISIILFVLLWAYFHQPITGIARSTSESKNVVRGENFVPYKRPTKSVSSQVFEISDDE